MTKIDLSNLRSATKNQISKNKVGIMSEKQMIENILKLARKQGCEEKVKELILKFQDAIKGARNEFERSHIAAMGLAEIHKTIGCVAALVVDGVQILPPDPSYQDAIDLHKPIVKLD